MHAKLICPTGPHAGSKFVVATEAVIGRDAVNDIAIAEPTITNSHARIYLDAEQGCYFLEDLGSKNGTTLDGVSVVGQRRLEKMHVITLARKVDLIFVLSKKDLPDQASSDCKQQGLRDTSSIQQDSEANSVFRLPTFNRSKDQEDPKRTQFGDGFEE